MWSSVCRIGCVGLLVGMMFVAGGCRGEQQIDAKYARKHMSPELESIAHMAEQRKNRSARTHDTNLRQIWDDIDMWLLLDRPMWLSEYPIP